MRFNEFKKSYFCYILLFKGFKHNIRIYPFFLFTYFSRFLPTSVGIRAEQSYLVCRFINSCRKEVFTLNTLIQSLWFFMKNQVRWSLIFSYSKKKWSFTTSMTPNNQSLMNSYKLLITLMTQNLRQGKANIY